MNDDYPCGHPRTQDNTKPHGKRNGVPQFVCRICRRKIDSEGQKARRAKRNAS